MLPAVTPDGEMVVHDVLADEVSGYVQRREVFGGGLGRALPGASSAATDATALTAAGSTDRARSGIRLGRTA